MEIPAADDMHIHLRQGEMMETVVPLVEKGGVSRCLVMPNLIPPITTMAQVKEYHGQLKALSPNTTFFMTLYLHPSLTPNLIREAKASGIVTGVKSYPKGVTTNSDSGIEDYSIYYEIFAEMERQGLILHLHGEIPSNQRDICVLNAESAFLKHLIKLNQDFPKLKIILEHATTADAISTVRDKCSETVGCTITAHHLYLTIDDWAGQPHNFCKPVAKYPSDREALREIVKSGHPRFFMGSDSAPHPQSKKESGCCPAGVFTSPYLMPYLAHIFDELGILDRLEPFVAHFGADFYGVPRNPDSKKIILEKAELVIPEKINGPGSLTIVPFRAGSKLNWRIKE